MDSIPVTGSGLGVTRRVAAGELACVDRFAHVGAHRDPDEESVHRPTVVFTRRGAWALRCAAGGGRLDTARVGLLDPARPYTCSHDERVPGDRTLAVTFRRPLDSLLAAHPTLLRARDGWTFATWSVPRTPALDSVARSLAALPASDARLRRLAVDALAVQLLLAVGRAMESRVVPVRADDAPERVAAALRYMRRHLAHDVRLADIAAAAGVDPFRLARLFRAELGSSPVRELRRLRLERAARLLRDRDLSVTDVSLASGHASVSRFITAFRQAYGLPPAAWRRAQDAAIGARNGKTDRGLAE